MSKIKELQSKAKEWCLTLEGNYIEHKKVDAFLKKVEKFPKLHNKLQTLVRSRRIVHWGRFKDTLVRGITLTGIPRLNVEVILNNTFEYLVNNTDLSGTYGGQFPVRLGLRTALKVALGISNKVGKFVSVQAMPNPVALAMRFHSTEGFGTRTVLPTLLGEFEERPDTRLDFEKFVVTASSRKLQAGWTLEAMQDLKLMHGVDIEEEITKAIASEAVHEIVAELIEDIKSNSPTVEIDFNPETLFDLPPDGEMPNTFLKTRRLGEAIRKAASDIALDTRRGAANIIIASPITVAMMQADPTLNFTVPGEGEVDKEDFNLRYAGTVNRSIKVYISMCFGAKDEGFIIGYRGTEPSPDCDAGFVYAPYLPLKPAGVVCNPETFQPILAMHSRYAKEMRDANYYRYIKYSAA